METKRQIRGGARVDSNWGKPNIILILNDDMGFSDLGCYGGEIATPNLNRLAAGGLRFSQFYNTARCCPSRASLLTGLYPHQADIGHMMDDDGVDGYTGDLNTDTLTIAEALGEAGYRAYMSGKWHLTRHVDGPKHNWPCQRGFDYLLRHHHRRLQLLPPQHPDPQQRAHRHPPRRVLPHRRHQRRGRRSAPAARRDPS